MHLKEDAEGRQGLSVSKDLVETGGHALKANITTLGPLVLPVSEQIHFFTNLLFKKKNQALHSCKEPPKSSYQQHNHDPCSPPFPVPSNPKFHTLCVSYSMIAMTIRNPQFSIYPANISIQTIRQQRFNPERDGRWRLFAR